MKGKKLQKRGSERFFVCICLFGSWIEFHSIRNRQRGKQTEKDEEREREKDEEERERERNRIQVCFSVSFVKIKIRLMIKRMRGLMVMRRSGEKIRRGKRRREKDEKMRMEANGKRDECE